MYSSSQRYHYLFLKKLDILKLLNKGSAQQKCTREISGSIFAMTIIVLVGFFGCYFYRLFLLFYTKRAMDSLCVDTIFLTKL